MLLSFSSSSVPRVFPRSTVSEVRRRSVVNDFRPTPEQVEQSRLNQLESESGFRRRLSSITAAIDQARQSIRRQSVGVVSTTVSDRRSRETRLLRPKFEYEQTDDQRIEDGKRVYAQMQAGSSPSALVVRSRQAGLMSEVEEWHGFCFDSPINVCIRTYPVYDSESVSVEPQVKATLRLKEALTQKTLKNKWAKVCITSHSSMFYSGPAPFDQMLRMKQRDFLHFADSGDILLEGTHSNCYGQYVQHKSDAITYHISVVYKDPRTNALYLLTSRKWSKHFKSNQQNFGKFLDFSTFRQIDGVQMHPLEDYIREKRQRGVYFIYRRLYRSNRKVTESERLEVGQQLFEWYSKEQTASGVVRKFPQQEEMRNRLRFAAQLRKSGEPPKKISTVLDSNAYSSSQVVTLALKHAGILADSINALGAALSMSREYEMKSIRYAPAEGSLTWSYYVLTLITGDYKQTSIQVSETIDGAV